MARFHGKVGYGETSEIPADSGVHSDVITERSYFGDVVRNTRRLSQGEALNKDLSMTNTISIVADAYANDNYANIRYVEWNGDRWTVQTVDVQRPRLLLYLGEVYNGPTPAAPVSP